MKFKEAKITSGSIPCFLERSLDPLEILGLWDSRCAMLFLVFIGKVFSLPRWTRRNSLKYSNR